MTEPRQDWDSSYRGDDPAPWDIGRPQPAFAALAERGRLVGDVLDAGCGTGEHALLAASLGARATGVDLSAAAVRIGRQKAAERSLVVDFQVGDIVTMPLSPAGFDVVIDSGLFHNFNDEDRGRYVTALGRLVRPGGTCYLLCFSDRQPGDWGPRRVALSDIERAFAVGWAIEAVDATVLDINPVMGETTVLGWLAELHRSKELSAG